MLASLSGSKEHIRQLRSWFAAPPLTPAARVTAAAAAATGSAGQAFAHVRGTWEQAQKQAQKTSSSEVWAEHLKSKRAASWANRVKDVKAFLDARVDNGASSSSSSSSSGGGAVSAAVAPAGAAPAVSEVASAAIYLGLLARRGVFKLASLRPPSVAESASRRNEVAATWGLAVFPSEQKLLAAGGRPDTAHTWIDL